VLRLGLRAQDEDGVGLSTNVLAGLCLEVAIQALHATGKSGAVVQLAERRNAQFRGWPFRHSPHNPALMFCKCLLEALVRSRRIDERVKKDGAIALGQHEGLVLRNRPTGGFRQRGHAEVGELAPFELSCSFD
jgi:hypothetical protein